MFCALYYSCSSIRWRRDKKIVRERGKNRSIFKLKLQIFNIFNYIISAVVIFLIYSFYSIIKYRLFHYINVLEIYFFFFLYFNAILRNHSSMSDKNDGRFVYLYVKLTNVRTPKHSSVRKKQKKFISRARVFFWVFEFWENDRELLIFSFW